MMIRRDPQMTAVVALTVAALTGVLAALVSLVDRPYPGFFFSANIAARLAAQADGGEVVLSESTLARLGAELPVEDLGVRALKNVEQPMRLFRLR